MKFLDAEFVKGFIRMANDGWEQGWHERNGGNLSYRVKPEAGAAWATILSQFLSAVLSTIVGLSCFPILHLRREDFHDLKDTAVLHLKTGFPGLHQGGRYGILHRRFQWLSVLLHLV